MSVTDSDSELDRLKTLLLADELALLGRLRAQVQVLEQRLGDDAALQASVTRIMSGALADSNTRDPRVLTRVLSPLIVSGIRSQVKNSADDLVEVMYPITGRLVTASVKGAIMTLAESINKQIESTLSPRGLMASLRAKISGRPVSDFLLAGSLGPKVQRALVVEKSSGKVLLVWRPEYLATQADDNIELVSGLLAALNNLAEEVFDDASGGLRTLDLDGRQIAMRRSASHMLVLELTGSMNSGEQQMLDASFIESIEKIEAGDLLGVNAVLDALLGQLDEARSSGKPKAAAATQKPSYRFQLTMAGLALAVLCVGPAKRYVADRQLDNDAAQIASLIAADYRLTGFPIRVKADYDKRRVDVSGLLPREIDLTELQKAWRLAARGQMVGIAFSRVLTMPISNDNDNPLLSANREP